MKRCALRIWINGTMQFHWLPIVSLVLTSVWLPTSTLADDVKLKRIWYKQVAIDTIEAGQLLFLNRSDRQFTKPLEQVTGFRIDKYPAVALLGEAMYKEDWPVAYKLSSQLQRKKIKRAWLRQWLAHQHVKVSNQVNDAVGVYKGLINLARGQADDYFFRDLPLQALAAASPTQAYTWLDPLTKVKNSTKARTTRAAQLNKAIALLEPIAAKRVVNKKATSPAATTSRRSALDRLKKAKATQSPTTTKPTAAQGRSSNTLDAMDTPRAPNTPGAPPETKTVDDAASQSKEATWAVAIPRSLGDTMGDDAITQQLVAGNFAEAYERADSELHRTSNYMSRRLYQRGLAQLMLADQSGKLDDYKAAGLDFMRVVIHYPKSTSYVSASLIEAGYVHQKLGQAQLANKLFTRALFFIDETEPMLAKRLEQLQAGGKAKK